MKPISNSVGGGISSKDATFTEASTRENISSGESISTLFGKIKKWFTDIPTLFVAKSGDTMTGNLQVNLKNGTTTTVGESVIRIGNNTAAGTAENSQGSLRLYGSGTKFANLSADTLTDDRMLKLPNKNGTLATADDTVAKSGDTMSGNLTIDKHSGTTSAVSTSDLILGNNISQGTAGNSLGRIDIYGSGQYRERLYCDTLTANRNIALPDKSGTVALTSDFGWSSAVVVNLNSGTATYQKHALLGLKRVTINSSNQPTTATTLTGKIPSDYIPVISTLGTFYDNNGNPRNVLFYDSGNSGKMMINAGSNTGLVGQYLYW